MCAPQLSLCQQTPCVCVCVENAWYHLYTREHKVCCRTSACARLCDVCAFEYVTRARLDVVVWFIYFLCSRLSFIFAAVVVAFPCVKTPPQVNCACVCVCVYRYACIAERVRAHVCVYSATHTSSVCLCGVCRPCMLVMLLIKLRVCWARVFALYRITFTCFVMEIICLHIKPKHIRPIFQRYLNADSNVLGSVYVWSPLFEGVETDIIAVDIMGVCM